MSDGLRREVRWLNLAVDQSPASILITDRDGRIEYVNEKFTEAWVELRSEAEAVVLRILDDGVGLPSRSPDQADRLGILGMQERAVLPGGRFELIDRDPSGLEVCVRVPYDVLDVSGRQG